MEISYLMRGGGGHCLHFWSKSFNFLSARLIREFYFKKKISSRSYEGNSVAATNPVFDLKIENVLPMALMRIKQNLGTQAIR